MPGQPITDFTLGGILFQVLIPEAGPFDFRNERMAGPERTVTYLVDGTKISDAADALMGVGSYAFGSGKFPRPHLYPGNPQLYCQSVAFGGWAGPVQPGPQLQMADQGKLIATYKVGQWDVDGSVYQDVTNGIAVPWSHLNVRGGYQEHGTDGLYTSDGTPMKRARVRIPLLTYTFSRSLIPSFLAYDALLYGLAGSINVGTFFGKAAGTVLLEDWSVDDQRSADGTWTQEFAITFLWRSKHWNYALKDGSTTTWLPISNPDLSPAPPYTLSDFTPLLNYGLV